MMQADWEIKSRAHQCGRTGREFAEGEFFYTILVREGEGFRREDMCEEAWNERNDNIQPFSFWRSKYEPPTPPPPEPLKQSPNPSTPEPFVLIHWLLPPSAAGRVNVKLVVLVIPLCSVTVLELVVFLKSTLPFAPETPDTPNVRPALPCSTNDPPLAVITDPDSLSIESACVCEPVNFGSLPAVPPGVVTAPVSPEQLGAVVHIL
jgi:hypothetical protein